MKRLALVAAGAVALALAAGATAYAADPKEPTPAPGTIGLRLTPAPVALDEGQRSVTVANKSDGFALVVTLSASDGFAVEPATLNLDPGEKAEVALTKVDPSRDGTLTVEAVAPDATTGAVLSALHLEADLRHASLFEQHGELLLLVGLAALAAVLAVVGLARRRLAR